MNLEALAEALYLASYPYLHQGAPAVRCWPDAKAYEQTHFRRYAKEIADLYEACLTPFQERKPLKLRDVAPELWEEIHGKKNEH